MTFDKYIGIDPGTSGGIAVANPSTGFVFSGPMPTEGIATSKTTKNGKAKMRNETDTARLQGLLREWAADCSPVCFIEKVQSHRGDTDDNPGKRFQIERMLANYEAIKASLVMCGIPFVEVYPISWQSTLHLKKMKGETKTQRKNRYKEAAQYVFPTQKVTLYNADALLLVRFGITKMKNEPRWVMERIRNAPDTSRLF